MGLISFKTQALFDEATNIAMTVINTVEPEDDAWIDETQFAQEAGAIREILGLIQVTDSYQEWNAAGILKATQRAGDLIDPEQFHSLWPAMPYFGNELTQGRKSYAMKLRRIFAESFKTDGVHIMVPHFSFTEEPKPEKPSARYVRGRLLHNARDHESCTQMEINRHPDAGFELPTAVYELIAHEGAHNRHVGLARAFLRGTIDASHPLYRDAGLFAFLYMHKSSPMRVSYQFMPSYYRYIPHEFEAFRDGVLSVRAYFGESRPLSGQIERLETRCQYSDKRKEEPRFTPAPPKIILAKY